MRIIYFIFLFFAGFSAFPQEIVTGLQVNPMVIEKIREMQMQKIKPTGEDTIPISLPFFDDFSTGGIFPSSSRWIDRFTYVNSDFPLYPIDYGAVTLDAINDSGHIYANGVPGPTTFIADRLTSRYIRLDSLFTPSPRPYLPSDSIFLSFYYQPQGRGRAPSTSDSLVLQFLVKSIYDTLVTVDTSIHIPEIWKNVWSSPGMALDTFFLRNNVYFKRVMIPITDTGLYFKKYFRFRFFNYVSLPSDGQPSWQSNCDQWNIDDVYLNYGRSGGDTVYKELRFVERPPSMLKTYTSMPYPQYSNDPSNEMTDTLSVILTNRDIVSRNASYSYYVTTPAGSFSKTYDSGPFIVLPYIQYSFGYLMHPPVPFVFPIGSADSTIFQVKHVVRDLAPGSVYGDTLNCSQKFYNYYSYDDGTPEAGYGLKGAGALMAYQFMLNKSDTLRAIRVYFNHTLGHNNQQYFYLTVWNDNNGRPGDTIYSRLAYVTYTDSLNKFYTYNLENPVRISGKFYIGTEQTTDDNLNIGLDLSKNSEEFMYYNSTGTWLQSTQGATLLMRPVVGKPIPVGIEPVQEKNQPLTIYPNPCKSGVIHIVLPGQTNPGNDETGWNISVYDLTGRKIAMLPYTGSADISSIPDGIYLLEVQHLKTLQRFSGKLVVIH